MGKASYRGRQRFQMAVPAARVLPSKVNSTSMVIDDSSTLAVVANSRDVSVSGVGAVGCLVIGSERSGCLVSALVMRGLGLSRIVSGRWYDWRHGIEEAAGNRGPVRCCAADGGAYPYPDSPE